MIDRFTQVRVRGTSYRVEDFQTVDDRLWVKLEQMYSYGSESIVMIPFDELVRTGEFDDDERRETKTPPTAVVFMVPPDKVDAVMEALR